MLVLLPRVQITVMAFVDVSSPLAASFRLTEPTLSIHWAVRHGQEHTQSDPIRPSAVLVFSEPI